MKKLWRKLVNWVQRHERATLVELDDEGVRLGREIDAIREKRRTLKARADALREGGA